MNKVGLRQGMMARVQRRADKTYNKKMEEWSKLNIISNGEKTLGKIEVGQKINDMPVRKVTKLFTRG